MSDPRSLRTPAGERELELQYAVDDEASVRALLADDQLAGLEAGPWRVVEVRDRYLDTPTRALAAGGYGARVRTVDGHHTVTLKKELGGRGRARSSRALSDRMEIEAPAGRGLDPRRWPQSAARSLIEAASRGDRLRTLFELEQQREERDLLQDGDVVARLSLDSATVRRFGRSKGTLTTLEIEAARELADDRRIVLDQLAAVLDDVPGLRPEPRSKEQLALQLVDRERAARRHVRPPRRPGIALDDALSEAGRKVLRMHMLRMLDNEPGVRDGRDPEHVHRMRVATRRMRAAWRVFDGAYRPRFARRYVNELRTVAAALGSVRDQDVQLERLATYRGGLDEANRPALDAIAAEWQRRREAARAELIDFLDSELYDQFTADYLGFVETAGAGATGHERVADVAGGRIWRAYERLRAHDTTLAWADTTALHALRIDGKRFRYTLEFFHEVLGDGADRLIADVVRLQDHLGDLNDAHISAELARAWLLESGSALTVEQRDAVGAYVHANEAQVERLTRTFGPLWRLLTGRPFRRRLGAVISAI